jgi:hypothetical protein
MRFRLWFTNEEQSQDALFMQTQKSGLGPKPSTNANMPKPSDGWLRGKGEPALFMKKKMKKESVFHEEIEFDPYEKVAKEMVYLLDTRPGSRGEQYDRSGVEQEVLKLFHRFLPDEEVDWDRLEELAKNFIPHVYDNYSEEYIKTQEGKLDALITYLKRYGGPKE